MNTYNLTKYKWKSLYYFHKSIPQAHENKPLMGLPFRVSIKSGEPLRSRLPKLPHPFIDEKTSSDKLSDLPKDIQQ